MQRECLQHLFSVLCVCVNVGSPGNGESSLSFLHFYQCNSIIQSTSNHSDIQSKINFLLKAVLYSNPKINFIAYSYFQHYIYMADSPTGVCLYMYIENLYTNIYSDRIAVYIQQQTPVILPAVNQTKLIILVRFAKNLKCLHIQKLTLCLPDLTAIFLDQFASLFSCPIHWLKWVITHC